MKKFIAFLGSFRTKVALVLIIGMCLMALASDLLVRQLALRVQFDQMRDKLRTVASAVASAIDPDMIGAVPRDRTGVQSPAYQTVFNRLTQIKQENPFIGFIYIMEKTPHEGVLRFVVDADPYLSHRGAVTAYPGDLYDASPFPNMLKAFGGALSEKEVQRDVWGSMLSGYAPILDKNGKAIAIVGVDMMASDIHLTQKAIHQGVTLALVFGAGLSLLFAFWLSSGLAGAIGALADGIRRVSRGDLDHRISVRGYDEIAELSRSFNEMAEDLRETRRKNSEYFYRIIRTLILIVEARDPYTRGHSERVAEYAAAIVEKMGFPKEKVEVLKQVAMLHDIGKLGIHENILSKKDKLTGEEWDLLRSHPVLGEEILRPVLLDPEMLPAVRGHHERYDGTGYPDHLAGDDINLFAQVLSVVDAYDAMTSTRSYRAALPQQEAVEELRRNRGTQFNPRIVDIFTELLNEKKTPA